MPATDLQASSATYRKSILSIRRDQQVHSTDASSQELDAFQKSVTDRFLDLYNVSSDEILSLDWIHKVLDAFLCCIHEFRVVLINNNSVVCKPPLDRLVHDYFERSLKALDVCNAIRDGIEQIRGWKKLLEIVLCAFDGSNNVFLREAQFRRAKKALIDLSISMIDGKESSAAVLAHRNRSFGRQKDHQNRHHSLVHFRSLSWSVSRSWSAARQLQAIAINLVAPRGNEVLATNGVVMAVYTMNVILLFVMWTLVAAIPCQDRGLQVHFSIPRQFKWAAPLMSMHDRILEESRKRDRRNARGLLREIYQIDKFVRGMSELSDSVQFPLTEENEREVRQKVQDLRDICGVINERLDPLERQVRRVFRKIVHCRTDRLDGLGRSSKQ